MICEPGIEGVVGCGRREIACGWKGGDSMGVLFFLMPCALFSVLWGGGSLPREV